MKRTIASAVTAALLVCAIRPDAYAAAVRVTLAAPGAGSSAASAAGASLSGSALSLPGTGLTLTAPSASLSVLDASRGASIQPGVGAVSASVSPAVSVSAKTSSLNASAAAPSAANAAASAAAGSPSSLIVPSAASRRAAVEASGRADASAALAPREAARAEASRMNRALAPDLQLSGRLSSVSGESAHAAGLRIDAILRGQAGRADGALAAADFNAEPGSGGFGLNPSDGKAGPGRASSGVPAPRSGFMLGREWLAPPARVYARALKAASDAAKAKGMSADQLYFSEASASMPVRDGAQWKFTFYLKKDAAAARADQVFVELFSFAGNTSNMESRVHVYSNIDVPARAARLSADEMRGLLAVEPEPALIEAQRQHAALGSGVGVALRAGADGALRYHFYDDYGAEVAVDALKGTVEVVKAAPVFKENPVRPIAIGLILLILFLLATKGFGAFAFLGAAGMLFGVKPEVLPNPAQMFPRALKEAKEAVRSSEVEFVRATASYGSEQKWIFTFRTPAGKIVDVSFSGGLTVFEGQYASRQTVYSAGPAEPSVRVDPRSLEALLRVSPEAALEAAQRSLPGFGRRTSVSLAPGPSSSGWLYRLYDEAGNGVSVDPVDGRADVFQRAK